MKIVMATNTYLPHVGGVAKSVHAFTQAFRRQGHDVLVVCPEFEEECDDADDVVRIPAIQHFNGSDFSVSLPFHTGLAKRVREFAPDIVHSHHPFLLGDTALRLASKVGCPVVFTYHTMYENYTHYVPAESEPLRTMAIDLAKGYCALCDHVIAPSASIADILRERGIETPMTAIPTGIDPGRFSDGDGRRFRRTYGWSEDTFVVGHVGRLAKEKNLEQLGEAVCRFLEGDANRAALIVGSGDLEDSLNELFVSHGLAERVVMPGQLSGRALADAYCAMDVFAFTSETETQGMVLAEAMSVGIPVVACDAPGARDIIRDACNGRLLGDPTAEQLADAMTWMAALTHERREEVHRAARQTARDFSLERCAGAVLDVYRRVQRESRVREDDDLVDVTRLKERFQAEWEIWMTRFHAIGAAVPGGVEG